LRDYAGITKLTQTEIEEQYYSFDIDKKDGDQRSITAPMDDLKSIQQRILSLLTKVQRPDWLMSAERGKSYITNGQAHLNSDYLLTMDIKKFYDNCKREYVYQFFIDIMKTSPDVSEILTNIVTVNGGIPTGCPTSQIIAYYAYQTMFLNIHAIAQKHNCIFTLYVDDMTFSSNEPFDPKRLMKDVEIELRKFGHRLKASKVKYYGRNRHKLVTGVALLKEHKLQIPNRLHKKIYTDAMKTKGMVVNQEISKEFGFLKSLQGRVQAARNVEPLIFPEIKRLVKRAIDMT